MSAAGEQQQPSPHDPRFFQGFVVGTGPEEATIMVPNLPRLCDQSNHHLVARLFDCQLSDGSVALADHLLDQADHVSLLRFWSLSKLMAVPGMSRCKASRFRAAMLLADRISTSPLSPTQPIQSSRDIIDAVGPDALDAPVETLRVIAVDRRNRPLCDWVAAIGSPTSCTVAPGDLLRSLLREGADGFFLVHNHPSGNASPSRADAALTRRVRRAAALVGLRFVDHLIMTEQGYHSLLAGDSDASVAALRSENPIERR